MKVNLCYKEVRERCQYTKQICGQTTCIKTVNNRCPARDIEKRLQKEAIV